MKGLSCSAVILFLVASACFGQAAPKSAMTQATSSTPVFTITVTPASGRMRLKEPLEVTVTLTNVSSGEIYLASSRGADSKYKVFHFSLTKNGKEVETTFFHRKITGRQRSDDPSEVEQDSSIVLSHPPGIVFEMTIDLTKLYQITEPGTYKLVVSRFDEYSKTTVQSAPVTEKIVE